MFLKNRTRRLLLCIVFCLVSGLSREIMLPELSVFSSYSLIQALLFVLFIYGGLGVLLGLVLEYFDLVRRTDRSDHRIGLDRQMLQQDAVSTVGMMTAGIVHNFKNYLEVMQSTADMLRKQAAEIEAVSRPLDIQQKCLTQARGAVDQLLWFVKREKSETDNQRPLNDILEDAVQLAELLVKVKNITIERDFDPVEPLLKINDISLMQSVINLIKNSVKASEPGSKIIVSSRFLSYQNTCEFCIIVRDFGKGMADEVRNQLFSPFFSGSQSGNGLGLYTVKQMVESDGGKVEVETSAGQGTAVSLRYPVMH